MKKKNFLSGSNAKLALIAVALTGGLLTGCYKDEGLDVITPSSTELPAPSYAITGSILDAETFAPVAGASVNGTAVKDGGTFTMSATTGDNTITATADNYTEAKAIINVEKVNAGQSAIYSKNILMQPNMTGTWKVESLVKDEAGNVLSANDYEVSFKGINDLNKVAAGNYTMTVKGKGEYAGETKYVDFTLAKVRFDFDGTYTVVARLKAQDAQVNGYVLLNGKQAVADVIELTVPSGKKYITSNTAYYEFKIPVSELQTITAANYEAQLLVTYKGEILPAIPVKITTGEEQAQQDYDITKVINGEIPGVKYEVNVAVAATGTGEETEEVVLSEITNNKETAKKVSFNYEKRTGAKYTTDVMAEISKVANLEAGSVVYTKIQTALLTEVANNYTVETAVHESEIPARSIAIPTLFYNSKLTTWGITISGANATAEMKKAETVKPESIEAVSAKFNLDIEGIDDGHSHSHGGDLNAGGGIGSAE